MNLSPRWLLLSLLLCLSPVCAQPNVARLISPEGDYIGGGRTYFTTNLSEFELNGTLEHLNILFAGFSIEIDPPTGELLSVGKYTGAVRFPFNESEPGLSVWGDGRGCNTACGEFEILELELTQAGAVDRLWCTFSHACECFMPAMMGEVRYRSLLAPPAPESQVRRVPADYVSIQEAIDAAEHYGDVVAVDPGVYPETVNFRGKRIVVSSTQGPAQTIIAPTAGHAVVFAAGETREAVLRGFTIRGADGGVDLAFSMPTISGNVITNCGFGINCYFASPLIESNRISGSRAGSGVYLGGAATAEIEGNTIESNLHGIVMFAAGNPVIRNNVIRGNQGDGLNLVNESNADIIQNVIAGNTGHGIAWLVPSGARGPFVQQNTIVANGQIEGAGIMADGFDGAAEIVNNLIVGAPAMACGGFNDLTPPLLRHNDVFAPAGPAYAGEITDQTGLNGNISVVPRFLNPAGSDYRLMAGSPGIDAATPDRTTAVDLEGNPRPSDGDFLPPALPDMGAYEFMPGPPRPVTTLSAVATPDHVALTWIPFDDATNYVLARASVTGGPYVVQASLAATQFNDSTATPGLRYFYVVAGQNSFGVGAYSAEISVRAGNRPPVATPDLVMTDEDSPVMFDPLANDLDPDGDPVVMELLSDPAAGELHLTNSGFSYVPPQDYFGTNSFEYRSSDGQGGMSTGLVTLLVFPVNDPPVAQPAQLVVETGLPLTALLRGMDIDSASYQFFLVTSPQHGLATVDPATGRLSYSPAHSFFGVDTLEFRVVDAEFASPAATVSLQVRAPLDLDRDGMADGWENRWDLNNPLADPDGDGASNLSEYLAQTSPRDPASNLRILAVNLAPNGECTVTYSSVGGTRHRLLSVDKLLPMPSANFLELARPAAVEIDPAPYGEPGIRTWIDRRPLPTNGTRFYRLKLVP